VSVSIQPAGNYYDKYNSGNPVARFLMQIFLTSFDQRVARSGARDAHEIGCGVGHLSVRMAKKGLKVRGSDISSEILVMARENAEHATQQIVFRQTSIYDVSLDDRAELVVCCEVLEHLSDPEQAVAILATLANPYMIASVPREPIWRVLNMCRGRYLSEWGNTPGHIQHWSTRRFLAVLSRNFEILAQRTPLPWTMALCRVRR
jgi:2-polyprenyl-3-methyl-5-hydroxy-6-metoxy-1,4-benzoquinol methylase